MSRNDWEEGSLKFSTAAWPKFKKSMQESVKKMYQHDYELAVKLHAALAEMKKGKRGFDIKTAFEKELFRTEVTPSRGWGGYSQTHETRVYDFKMLESYRVRVMILGPHPFDKFQKPQKKDLPVVNGTTLEFSYGEMSVRLDNEARTAHYDSGHNNRAQERARQTPLGQLFFELLKEVNWTRGTGGVLVGNDENRNDDHSEGGASNYVTARFGPLGEPAPFIFKLPRTRKPKKTAAAQGTRSMTIVTPSSTVHLRRS